MAIFDKQNMFSENQTLIAAAGTVIGTNVIDLGVARNIGGSTHPTLELWAQITSTFLAAAGAATLQLLVETSPDNVTFATLASSPAVAKASLVAGYKFGINFLPDVTSRYVRVSYVIGTNPGTAGTVTAGLVPSGEYQTSYPSNYVA